jgi:anti-sigma B factor antagonist
MGEQGLIELCRQVSGQPLPAVLEMIEQAAPPRPRDTVATTSRCWACACDMPIRPDANIPNMTGDKHLQIEVSSRPDRVILVLHGELDLVGAPLLQSEIESAEVDAAEMVVLDLEDLQFIDSSGLRVILSAHGRARSKGQAFALTPGSQQVQRLLSIAGVSEYLQIIASSAG